MPAREPHEVSHLASEAFNAGNLDALASLYEPEATLVVQPGQPVTGIQAIREALREFVAITKAFDVSVKTVVHGPGVALVLNDWVIHGAAPDGSPVEMRGSAADVVRQQPDGTWLLVIDNPWSAA